MQRDDAVFYFLQVQRVVDKGQQRPSGLADLAQVIRPDFFGESVSSASRS
jgi:hypothetical protein